MKYLERIDDLDMKILEELVKDASISVPRMSKKINVNTSVVYSRIKRLIKHRVRSFAFFRMLGVVRSVDDESLLTLSFIGE